MCDTFKNFTVIHKKKGFGGYFIYKNIIIYEQGK